MFVYLCEPTLDGMLTGIYDAWASGKGHANVRLELLSQCDMELFCEYITVVPDADKARKVAGSIRRKISEEVYEHCYRALCGCAEDRVDAVYRFLILAFRIGPGILTRYGDPVVMRVFELRRYMSDECHLLYGFTRFEEYDNHVLVARIAPNNDVIEVLALHFADRLAGERFVIYDIRRKRYVCHQPGQELLYGTGELPLEQWRREDDYQDLWKAFFDSIAIRERNNPRCQRNLLPLRYRPQMTEFTEGTQNKGENIVISVGDEVLTG